MLPCTYRSYNLSVRHLYTSSFAEHGKFAIHYFDNNPAENYVMIETEPYLVAHESSLDWPYFEHPASAVDDTSAYIYMIHGYGGIDTLYPCKYHDTYSLSFCDCNDMWLNVKPQKSMDALSAVDMIHMMKEKPRHLHLTRTGSMSDKVVQECIDSIRDSKDPAVTDMMITTSCGLQNVDISDIADIESISATNCQRCQECPHDTANETDKADKASISQTSFITA